MTALEKALEVWQGASTLYVPNLCGFPFDVWGVVLIPKEDRSLAIRLWAYSNVPMEELCD